MRSLYKIIKFSCLGFLVLLAAIALFNSQERVFSKDTLAPTDKIKFKGKIVAEQNLSAVGFVGEYILIGSDEGNTVQVLEPNKKRSKYRVVQNIELLDNDSKPEVDIEGIAVDDNTVHVAGSHSVNEDIDRAQNNRQNIFRFQLNFDTGKLESSIEQKSLQTILEQDLILSQFANIPHEENGVDIEGIATKSDRLYFGFRTPVLQDSYVPVVVVKFEEIDRTDKYDLRYVNLDGNGIRDLVAVDDGFLILADATGENADHYQVYFWDGSDGASKSGTLPSVKFLSEIPTKKNTRAEGITVLTETASSYQILVVYDGVSEGNPTIFDIQKSY